MTEILANANHISQKVFFVFCFSIKVKTLSQIILTERGQTKVNSRRKLMEILGLGEEETDARLQLQAIREVLLQSKTTMYSFFKISTYR